MRKQMDDFRIKLGFGPHHPIMSKEESIATKISKLFKKEKNKTTTECLKLLHCLIFY